MSSFETLRSRVSLATRHRFRACLLAGAAGDALGAAVEFMSKYEIRACFGPGGIRDYDEVYGRLGAITDDTQMTLFTAEGLLRAWTQLCSRGIVHTRSMLAASYIRWLKTQGIEHRLQRIGDDGWLIGIKELHSRRAPGQTCIEALRQIESYGDVANNQSKGCGGVMRAAPAGLFFAAEYPSCPTPEDDTAFEAGCELARITHRHPSGILSAGLFAYIIYQLIQDIPLPEAIAHGMDILCRHTGHEETANIVQHACELATKSPDPSTLPEELGQGWVAEEALAIAIYAALVAPDLESGVILAVNHGGDSDSTGSIAGNLLGAMYGLEAIPSRWLADLELRDVIEEIADDLASHGFWEVGEYNDKDGDLVWSRYPGG